MNNTGERFIPGQHGITEFEHLNRYYFVVTQIDLKDKNVLDIASGEGYGSNILAQYAHQVIGIDISKEAVEHATNQYRSTNLQFLEGNAIAIPLQSHSIDVIVSFETIEHHDKHHEMMNEIKRILKTDGILIISSPDKYYYSELPHYKNEFHIKELYYQEFKDLIHAYFTKTIFYSQRTFVGSMIVLDEENQTYKKPKIVDNEGYVTDFTPVYNIAIGTDSISFTPHNQLVLYKPFDEILTYVNIQNAMEDGMQKIRNTKAYRLGKFLLKPFMRIKNRLR